MIVADITTMKDADKAIQDLIDSFHDSIFLDACDAMQDAAKVAADARREELDED